MTQPSIKVKGLAEMRRGFKDMDAELSRDVDSELKDIAALVATEAASRFSAIDSRTAAGFKARLRGFGRVTVTQSRRSKGLRPDYGGLQMTEALIPALWDKAGEVERKLESMLTRLERKHGF